MTRAEQDRLLDIRRDQFSVAVVSDGLDASGLHDQAMDARLRPPAPSVRLVGRAHSVATTDVSEIPADPYHAEIEAIAVPQPGDVLIAATGRSRRTCVWGALLATAVTARGATGSRAA